MLHDTIPEPAETFFVNLSGPVAATLGDGQGVATILDNDTTPSLSISDASIEEGDTGTRDPRLHGHPVRSRSRRRPA